MERSLLAGGAPEVVLPVCLAGLGSIAVAAAIVASAPSTPDVLAGPLLLLALAVAAEHLPLPLAPDWKISFSSVFIIAVALLYGTATAVLVGGLTIVLAPNTYRRRKHPVRVLFNASTVALAAGAAALAAESAGGRDAVLPATIAAAATSFLVSLVLVCAVASGAEHIPFRRLAALTSRLVAPPFAMAVSIVPLFVIAWDSSRLVAVSATIPLAGVGLHLRSLERSRKSLELALTDPLTGLGNRRHFDERLRRELDRAEAEGTPLGLVVIDLNRLKAVNDRFGHDAGDRLLRDAAACLRQGGEAFRFGGDEFALLLPGTPRAEAEAIVEAARARLAGVETEDGRSAGAAFGVATYPDVGRDGLVRAADQAAYRDKPAA
jgi:diguanylate cyclase